MPLQWLLDRFRENSDEDAIAWHGRVYRYAQLLAHVESARTFLQEHDVRPGEIVLIDADFSPRAIALMIAAMVHRNIIVPVASHVVSDRERLAQIAEASRYLKVAPDEKFTTHGYRHQVRHELLLKLQQERRPGIVFFSSGSTGQPKGAVHDLERLINKFKTPRHKQRLITFLLFDHIGGFNTMMYGLANGGCLITIEKRDVVSVCRAISEHRAEVLPASPTFLSLLIMSEVHRDHDLSSLKVINYATEVMPETVLKKLNSLFPHVSFRQSYGLSELGIMRSKSKGDDSVWVKVGGEDYQTRIVDGVLHVKAKSSMLGYLNAPSPFDADGWFNTEDEVDVRDGWFRFKGRKSDIINVGGEKVYPAEIESVILEVDNIADVTVHKEAHRLIGNIVAAEVTLQRPETIHVVTTRIRKHCFSKLPAYKVPVKVTLSSQPQVSARFKKERSPGGTASP